ncbi:MAG: hypothetical protein WDM71_04115 [Ferruginibacter sp.]
MKRKDFLSSIIPIGAVFANIATGKTVLNDPDISVKFRPTYKRRYHWHLLCCRIHYIR